MSRSDRIQATVGRPLNNADVQQSARPGQVRALVNGADVVSSRVPEALVDELVRQVLDVGAFKGVAPGGGPALRGKEAADEVVATALLGRSIASGELSREDALRELVVLQGRQDPGPLQNARPGELLREAVRLIFARELFDKSQQGEAGMSDLFRAIAVTNPQVSDEMALVARAYTGRALQPDPSRPFTETVKRLGELLFLGVQDEPLRRAYVKALTAEMADRSRLLVEKLDEAPREAVWDIGIVGALGPHGGALLNELRKSQPGKRVVGFDRADESGNFGRSGDGFFINSINRASDGRTAQTGVNDINPLNGEVGVPDIDGTAWPVASSLGWLAKATAATGANPNTQAKAAGQDSGARDLLLNYDVVDVEARAPGDNWPAKYRLTYVDTREQQTNYYWDLGFDQRSASLGTRDFDAAFRVINDRFDAAAREYFDQGGSASAEVVERYEEAAEALQRATVARDVLGNPEKRALYDEYGSSRVRFAYVNELVVASGLGDPLNPLRASQERLLADADALEARGDFAAARSKRAEAAGLESGARIIDEELARSEQWVAGDRNKPTIYTTAQKFQRVQSDIKPLASATPSPSGLEPRRVKVGFGDSVKTSLEFDFQQGANYDQSVAQHGQSSKTTWLVGLDGPANCDEYLNGNEAKNLEGSRTRYSRLAGPLLSGRLVTETVRLANVERETELRVVGGRRQEVPTGAFILTYSDGRKVVADDIELGTGYRTGTGKLLQKVARLADPRYDAERTPLERSTVVTKVRSPDGLDVGWGIRGQDVVLLGAAVGTNFLDAETKELQGIKENVQSLFALIPRTVEAGRTVLGKAASVVGGLQFRPETRFVPTELLPLDAPRVQGYLPLPRATRKERTNPRYPVYDVGVQTLLQARLTNLLRRLALDPSLAGERLEFEFRIVEDARPTLTKQLEATPGQYDKRYLELSVARLPEATVQTVLAAIREDPELLELLKAATRQRDRTALFSYELGQEQPRDLDGQLIARIQTQSLIAASAFAFRT